MWPFAKKPEPASPPSATAVIPLVHQLQDQLLKEASGGGCLLILVLPDGTAITSYAGKDKSLPFATVAAAKFSGVEAPSNFVQRAQHYSLN